ncbi:transposase, partial [Alteromonas sp. 1_MG-2023]|nr:transposase [Alteromonas sp. 1_MG-2023]
DYLELVENTGRQVIANKTGVINHNQSPILVRTGLQHTDWHNMVLGIENQFSTSISLSIALRRQTKLETS